MVRGSYGAALLFFIIFAFSADRLYGQAEYTATRKLDIQAGGSFTLGKSNYLPWDTQGNPAPLSDLSRKMNLVGGGAYLTIDFRPRIGAEFNYHHLSGTGNSGKQSTYEIGARYIFTRRFNFLPCGRLSYGRGIYRYPSNVASLSFNLFGVAGGLDYHLSPSINLCAEYQYQKWLDVPLRSPNPQGITVGVAYHFH